MLKRLFSVLLIAALLLTCAVIPAQADDKPENELTVEFQDTIYTWGYEDVLVFDFATKVRKCQLTVTCEGNAAITYKSGNSKVKVSSTGLVTVPASFVGFAEITISSAETDEYQAASFDLYVYCYPDTPVVTATCTKAGTIDVSWTCNTAGVKGYELNLYTGIGDDEDILKRVTVSASKNSYTFTGLSTGTYYVDVMAYANDCGTGCAPVKVKVGTFTNNITVKVKGKVYTGPLTYAKSASKRNVQLKVTVEGKAPVTYKCSKAAIKVSAKGKVTIPAGFKGKFTVTVTAGAVDGYKKTTKKIVFIVK